MFYDVYPEGSKIRVSLIAVGKWILSVLLLRVKEKEQKFYASTFIIPRNIFSYLLFFSRQILPSHVT